MVSNYHQPQAPRRGVMRLDLPAVIASSLLLPLLLSWRRTQFSALPLQLFMLLLSLLSLSCLISTLIAPLAAYQILASFFANVNVVVVVVLLLPLLLSWHRTKFSALPLQMLMLLLSLSYYYLFCSLSSKPDQMLGSFFANVNVVVVVLLLPFLLS